MNWRLGLQGELKKHEQEWNPWGEDSEMETLPPLRRAGLLSRQWKVAQADVRSTPWRRVEIWGKAAIGLYLWEHVLGGELPYVLAGGQWKEGSLIASDVLYSFYTGPAVVPRGLPVVDGTAVVLVLNGREQSKVTVAQEWLRYLGEQVRGGGVTEAALVLLGNERCENDWLRPFLRKHGGFVEPVFLVYDSQWTDEHTVFQWPLGVATYRHFPLVKPEDLNLETPRRYICNFLGTVYPGSSREMMLNILSKEGLSGMCFLHTRTQWQPMETVESLGLYRHALQQSDLTLSPVGINTECYRIYEAAAYGSVPVVEDVMTPGYCGTNNNNSSNVSPIPLHLLKASNAPFIFLTDWRELPKILQHELALSMWQKVQRRVRLVRWYHDFLAHLRKNFTKIIRETFFHEPT
uniref:Ribitol xylosyltransferase 1 n=1 Tax=Eptatretus burgeri TaxID=7764 RepID=A0A8C4WYQ0_EPTBU